MGWYNRCLWECRRKENSRKVTDFSEGRGMVVSNTFFDYKNTQRYTKVDVGRDGTKLKSLIDFVGEEGGAEVCVNVKSMRRLWMGISDHYTVLCKINLVKA